MEESSEVRHVKAFETVLPDRKQPSKVVNSNQPFHVRLILDPTEVPDATACNVLVYARPLQGGIRKMVGGASQLIHAETPSVSVEIPARTLLPGMYRLEAAIHDTPASSPSAETTFKEVAESGVVHIY
jgi:hypothetical protein